MTAEEEDRVSEVPERTDIEKKLEAGAWGLFFVWVGVAWWAGLSWGIGLLGVALITLGAQVVRRAYKLSVEPFWIVVGLCFAVAGIWEFLETDTSAVPIVLILVGGALLLMLFKRRGR
jgi:hypothetical protein